MNKKRFYLFKNTIRGNFGEVDKPLKNTEIVDLLNKQQATIKDLNEENEQLKIANARWLDKSLQDKQIRYDNLTCNELTKKYLQLKEENEQLKEEIRVYPINEQYAEEIIQQNQKLRIERNDLRRENEQLKQEVFVYKKAFQQQVRRCTL